MTDAQFEKLIDRTAKAQRKYATLLELAENEYERRYGAHPSDIDDDGWIDALHGCCGLAQAISVKQVDESAKLSLKTSRTPNDRP